MSLKTGFTFLACAFSLSASAQNGTFTAAYMADGSVEKDQYRSYVTLESVRDNGCVVYATGGVHLNLSWVTMNKTAGIGTYSDAEDPGTNSALLATAGSSVTVFNCSTNLHAAQSYGIIAADPETVVRASGGKTTVSREKSSGFHSTGGAMIEIDDYEIHSYDNMSPLLSAGTHGQIEASGIKGATGGAASPLFSSNGDIHVSDSRLEAGNAPVGHVKGNGIIRLEECDFVRASSCGFYISEGNGTAGRLSMDGCKLKLADGPMFLVDDGCAEVSMKKNGISYSKDGLICMKGGSISLDACSQQLRGDIVTDSICSVSLTLGKGSSYDGCINGAGNGNASVTVTLEKGSSWHASGSSHVSAISFQQGVEKGIKQIKGTANVYYDAKNPANSYLGGREYQLNGKGRLIPE